MQAPVNQVEDANSRTAQLVKLIFELGPDIPEISRRLGQFKESVRYRYKEKLLEKGFAVQASVSHEKLGLKRVVVLADFAPEFLTYADSILAAMNELCYVVYFEKRMFTGDFLMEASVPSEFISTFTETMGLLKEKGLFSRVEVIPFDWFRIVPMRTEFYDFDTGRWDFDWSEPRAPSEEVGYTPSAKTKFDRDDLLVIKELQMDATRNFLEMATKLKENYKNLNWHFKTHVIQRGMIGGYYLRWMGTTYSTALEKALHRQHRYHHLALFVAKPSQVERMNLMSKLHGLPFLWSEMVGEEDYCAHFYFPTESVTEAYQFITSAVSSMKDRVRAMPLDQAEALSFTLSYQLFDENKREWIFDQQQLLNRFDNLITKIKEVGGGS